MYVNNKVVLTVVKKVLINSPGRAKAHEKIHLNKTLLSCVYDCDASVAICLQGSGDTLGVMVTGSTEPQDYRGYCCPLMSVELEDTRSLTSARQFFTQDISGWITMIVSLTDYPRSRVPIIMARTGGGQPASHPAGDRGQGGGWDRGCEGETEAGPSSVASQLPASPDIGQCWLSRLRLSCQWTSESQCNSTSLKIKLHSEGQRDSYLY